MKRHPMPDAMATMEAGRPVALNRPAGTVNMAMPHIQPYQADPSRKSASSHSFGGSSSRKGGRDDWQKVSASGGAIWFGGWVLGYGFLWPLYLVLHILGAFTPFGSLLGWWDRGAPTPDLYPAASELRLPASQVSRYLENYVRSYGDAALIFASHDGYSQLVRSMLMSKDLGYHDLIDAADESGHTALLYAAGYGFPEVATALLRGGADPDAPRQGKNGLGLTSLMQAAGGGHREVVQALLQVNATVDLRDERGNTALMYAAHTGQLGAIQELLQRGAMRDLANKWGDTALTMAGASGHQTVMDALQRGARPVVDGQGRRNARSDHLASAAETAVGAGSAVHRPSSATDETAGLLSSMFSKGSSTEAVKDLASLGLGSLSGASSDARIKELEAKVASMKNTHEEAELKAQRRIVELLEQSTDKQKRLDDNEKEMRELRQRAEEQATKLRQKEATSLEDQERSSKSSKEAHEARMEAERERTRAEAAEREKTRQVEEGQRLEEEAKRKRAEAADHASQVERLQAQLKTLRTDLDRAEDERRRAQRELQDYRAGITPAAQDSLPSSASSGAAAPPDATKSAANATNLVSPAVVNSSGTPVAAQDESGAQTPQTQEI